MQPKKYLNGGEILLAGGTGAATGAMVGAAAGGIGAIPGAAIGFIGSAGAALLNGMKEDRALEASKRVTTPMLPTSTGHVFAMGGNIMDQYSEIEAGGTHEQNPNGGVPVSNKALLEEGEVKVGNKVFSKRIINPKTGKSFADEAKSYVDKKRPNDVIANTYSQKMLDGLFNEQEALKVASQPQEGQPQVMADGGIFGAGVNTGIQGSPYSSTPDYTGGMDPLNKGIISPMMYAPIASAAVGLGTTLLSKPEKKDLNMFNNNDTLEYKPVDFSQVKRDINSAYSASGTMLPNATRGNAGSYLANLQGLATSRGKTIGSASLQAEIANNQNEVQTDTYNSQLNSQNQANRMQVANMNDADRAAYKSALLDSISNLGNNVGGAGRQVTNANIANLLSDYDINGNYKTLVAAWEEAKKIDPNITWPMFEKTYGKNNTTI